MMDSSKVPSNTGRRAVACCQLCYILPLTPRPGCICCYQAPTRQAANDWPGKASRAGRCHPRFTYRWGPTQKGEIDMCRCHGRWTVASLFVVANQARCAIFRGGQFCLRQCVHSAMSRAVRSGPEQPLRTLSTSHAGWRMLKPPSGQWCG